jgi:hypothetical protein
VKLPIFRRHLKPPPRRWVSAGMASVRIDGGTLHVELKGVEALWAFHGSFAIPLTNVSAASVDKPPGFWSAIRLFGTGAYPFKAAGTFLYHGEVVFFDYRGGEDVLVIDLAPGASAYKHLFVHIDAPDTPREAAARINAALPTTPTFTATALE